MLTDSLAAMRDHYGIYAILSPNRASIVPNDMKGSGKGYGRAIEEIQNVEATKDQLVGDRAHYVSNLNEFGAAKNDAMQYLKVITRAVPPVSPTGPSLTMTVTVAMLCGLLFSSIFVLLMAYYKLIVSQER